MKKRWHHIRDFLKRLGPGLVTGAADDDPSGIGTYSQAGAKYGYALGWLMPLMLPMMTVIQEMAGRVGLVTGKGLATVIRENYNRWLLYLAVFLLVFANTVNIGADIGAMAASAKLIVDIPVVWLTLFFTLGIVLLEVIIPYKRYAKILKWLCLSLLAYIVTAFIVDLPWKEALHSTLVPHFQFNRDFILMIVALLGTTISPYLFFWEPSQVVEEEIEHRWTSPNSEVVKLNDKKVKAFRKDNFVGMLSSQIVAYFIMVTAAATLHAQGIFDVQTADQAAKALEPLVHGFPNAGQVAQGLFAVGIIGTGLLAIPVLAGSAGYAVAEALEVQEGLFRKVKRAKVFYGVIAGATLLGLLINFVGISPIKALLYSAVINGVLAVPLIFLIIHVADNPKIMGQYRSGLWTKIIGWVTFAVMLAAVLGMIFL